MKSVIFLIGVFILAIGSKKSGADETTRAEAPGATAPVFTEDWSAGKIDPARWYLLRKQWGQDNHGVVPENVWIEKDVVAGQKQNVLVCEAHGDLYDGKVVGENGEKSRVGGVIVSKAFFASGKFEVVMKIGGDKPVQDGPPDPKRPAGAIPAIWTYGYRLVTAGPEHRHEFFSQVPLYNPHMEVYGNGSNEYWSEIDFPEFGKAGLFDKAMYNSFCQNREHNELFDVAAAIDGNYHTYTTEWRTKLVELPGIKDGQVIESEGYFWIKDLAVPFESYLGNPLKRLDTDRYAICTGEKTVHWIDGRKLGESARLVPAMAAQLNLGIWLPKWAGPAAWRTAQIRIASVNVWQYHDPGDVRGVLTSDITDSFDKDGNAIGRRSGK